MSQRHRETDGRELRDRDIYFREELLRELRRLIKTLVREDSVFISDRKIVKLYRLIRTRAWIVHGGAVERQDLQILSYVGDTALEIDLLEDKVPRLLGLA
jgi:MoxR-like ATPase